MNVLQWLLPGGVGGGVGLRPSAAVVGFEDILEIQKLAATSSSTTLQRFGQGQGPMGAASAGFILINTLSLNDQEILISKTTPAKDEEAVLNQLLDTYQTAEVRIVVYGRNSADTSVFVKQDQIRKLGFTHVYVYLGGLFEWLLLQDVYGADAFRTTHPCRDILKYAAARTGGSGFS
jgi:hypothetical protein